MRVNLAWVTLFFCGGITLAHFIIIPFWLIYSIALILYVVSILCLKKGFTGKALLLTLLFTLGALLLSNVYALPKSHISKFIFYKNSTIFTVKGFIGNEPVVKDGRSYFNFAVQELRFNESSYKCSGDILVILKEAEWLSYGEALILRGSLHKPFKLYRNDIAAIMRVNNSASIIRLRKNYGQPLQKLAFYIKKGIEKIIYQRLSPLTASILDAMVLGDKKNIPPAVYDSMSKTGTVHILVVSGFNVGIVAFIIMLILKVSRLPRKARYVLAILCVIIYCFATGVQAPVLRATIMAVFLLTGFLIRREPDVRNSFSLAMFFILLTDPRALFSISFQLSFVSVAAIVFLYPKLKAFFRVDYLKLKVFKALAESFLISLSAWLGTLGFIAYYFNFFSPVTVLANLFIVPLATLITLSGFSLVVISLIFPVLAGYFAYANEFFVAMLLAVSSMLVRLPFAYLYL